jgi:hypothetical protein
VLARNAIGGSANARDSSVGGIETSDTGCLPDFHTRVQTRLMQGGAQGTAIDLSLVCQPVAATVGVIQLESGKTSCLRQRNGFDAVAAIELRRAIAKVQDSWLKGVAGAGAAQGKTDVVAGGCFQLLGKGFVLAAAMQRKIP